MMQKFSVNYKTYSQDEDLSFEPYLFKNKMIWIWESNATQPPIWYAGRHEDGRLMTLEDRCRKFLTERKIDFQALDFTQRKIKEIIIGKQLRSTMRTPISSQFELLLQQKVLQNLDYFNLKTEIGFERVFNNKEFDLDYHFLPKNLTTEVSPLKNEIMFDMPELIDSFIESTLPVQELLGPITMTLSKDDQIKSEISTNVLTQVEETTQIPQTAIEDFLNDKSKEIVPKFVRSVYAEYNDKHIIPKINLSFRPFSMNIVPAKLHPIEMLYPTKDFNDIAEPIIIYSPPGNGKTKFMIDNKLESVLVDTDYYRSEYKDGALIYDLLRHGRSVITNHIEFLPYFAAKYPILAIVPRTKTVTIARMYSKLSRRQTIETVTEWSEGVYKDLEKLNIFKDIQLKIIELDDSEYISTISEKVIKEALKLRFKDLRLRINDWKRLNYKISSYKED